MVTTSRSVGMSALLVVGLTAGLSACQPAPFRGGFSCPVAEMQSGTVIGGLPFDGLYGRNGTGQDVCVWQHDVEDAPAEIARCVERHSAVVAEYTERYGPPSWTGPDEHLSPGYEGSHVVWTAAHDGASISLNHAAKSDHTYCTISIVYSLPSER